MPDIHPTAIVDSNAQLADDVVIGPYCIVDAGVRLGSGCILKGHVHLIGLLEAGSNNVFHSGCVIGDAPQDLKYKGDPTRLRIGSGNTFREHVTVHRSNKVEGETVLGDGNFLMANAHVGHDCVLGNQNILANGVLLAGHVEIADQTFISGNCLVHQFTRIGRLALMQGGAGISKDLPPFTIARGVNHIAGLNTIGLRRAGMNAQTRLQLRQAYHALFRNGEMTPELEALEGPVAELIHFVRSSRRGVCPDPAKGRKGSSQDDQAD